MTSLALPPLTFIRFDLNVTFAAAPPPPLSSVSTLVDLIVRVGRRRVGAAGAVDDVDRRRSARWIVSLPSPRLASTLISAPRPSLTSTLSSPAFVLRSSVSDRAHVEEERRGVVARRGDALALRGDDEVLVARAAVVHAGVVAGAALEDVRALARVPGQDVVAVAAGHVVVALGAGHGVVARAAVHHVGAVGAGQDVVAVAARVRDLDQVGGARLAGDRVVAPVALDRRASRRRCRA